MVDETYPAFGIVPSPAIPSKVTTGGLLTMTVTVRVEDVFALRLESPVSVNAVVKLVAVVFGTTQS
jgi:hypothetical protein